MPNPEPDRTSADSTPDAIVVDRPRSSRNRRRVAIGAVGMAAVLGAGGYALTRGSEPATESAQAPMTITHSSDASAAPATSKASAATKESQKAGNDTTVNAEPTPKSAAERIREAREAAARDGVKITRPLPAKDESPERVAAAASAKEVTVGSAKEGGTMRIVTAHGDLSGQREIGWVAGGIKKHGKVQCSQRFKLYNEQEPKTRPSLLVCWRTSAERSVIVADTKIGGRPSVEKSLSVIEREWRKLG